MVIKSRFDFEYWFPFSLMNTAVLDSGICKDSFLSDFMVARYKRLDSSSESCAVNEDGRSDEPPQKYSTKRITDDLLGSVELRKFHKEFINHEISRLHIKHWK